MNYHLESTDILEPGYGYIGNDGFVPIKFIKPCPDTSSLDSFFEAFAAAEIKNTKI